MRDFDLRALQLAELELLKDFADFCDENGIVYFLYDGTLLGAARHRGFIPWDDDIDICMDVRNYRKLMKLADRLPKRMFFQSFRTDPKYPLRWPKIRRDGTTCMTASLSGLDMHFGVGMDVFIMSGVAKTRPGKAVQRLASLALTALLLKHRARVAPMELPGAIRVLQAIVPEPLRLLLARGMERLLLMHDIRMSDYAFSNFYDLKSGYEDVIPASFLDPDDRVRLPFEDAMLWCPGRYDEALAAHYGDWRTPPPAAERETHGDLIVDLEHDYKQYYTGK